MLKKESKYVNIKITQYINDDPNSKVLFMRKHLGDCKINGYPILYLSSSTSGDALIVTDELHNITYMLKIDDMIETLLDTKLLKPLE